MHISDFDQLRQMADRVDFLDRRSNDLNTLLLNGTWHHFRIFPVEETPGLSIPYESRELLFQRDDVADFKVLLVKLRDQYTSEAKRIREQFFTYLKTWEPGQGNR